MQEATCINVHICFCSICIYTYICRCVIIKSEVILWGEKIVPKGKKDIIKAHAEAHSESVNGFINRAIDEAIERDESAPAASEGQREG